MKSSCKRKTQIRRTHVHIYFYFLVSFQSLPGNVHGGGVFKSQRYGRNWEQVGESKQRNVNITKIKVIFVPEKNLSSVCFIALTCSIRTNFLSYVFFRKVICFYCHKLYNHQKLFDHACCLVKTNSSWFHSNYRRLSQEIFDDTEKANNNDGK